MPSRSATVATSYGKSRPSLARVRCSAVLRFAGRSCRKWWTGRAWQRAQGAAEMVFGDQMVRAAPLPAARPPLRRVVTAEDPVRPEPQPRRPSQAGIRPDRNMPPWGVRVGVLTCSFAAHLAQVGWESFPARRKLGELNGTGLNISMI